MKVIGIISEFNPLHNGHSFLIDKVRDPLGAIHADCIVSVMSGNFVQRGEPAIMSKEKRVMSALSCGIDLVLELPSPWVLQSAEGFANGAVAILNALGTVDGIAFGSECGDIQKLTEIADLMLSDRFVKKMRYHLEGGISYAEAQQKALEELGNENISEILEGPNNILGIEYIKAAKRFNAPFTFYTIKREKVEHDALKPRSEFASASYIRDLIRHDHLINALPYLPASSRDILTKAVEEKKCPSNVDYIDRALIYKLRQMSIEDFKNLPFISEGLENRFYEIAQKATSLEEFILLCKTKRYPQTRLQRILCCAYLNISKKDILSNPPYIRPLGSNEIGMEFLRNAKNNGCTLPILTRVSKVEDLSEEGKRIWQIENRVSDLYSLSLPLPESCGQECKNGIIKFNSNL